MILVRDQYLNHVSIMASRPLGRLSKIEIVMMKYKLMLNTTPKERNCNPLNQNFETFLLRHYKSLPCMARLSYIVSSDSRVGKLKTFGRPRPDS